MMEMKLVVVHREYGLLRAKALKAKLEDFGIPAVLEYESAGPVFGIIIDGMGEVRICTPARWARWAKRLLHNPRRPEMHQRWGRIFKARHRFPPLPAGKPS
ncbi:MAG: hypothetical protein JW900_00050 [Anaerolineae bacterium]|nr:hypothetical protein [Anaerolineae bacterium]